MSGDHATAVRHCKRASDLDTEHLSTEESDVEVIKRRKRDDKILPEIFGPRKVDRLPVLVSGDGTGKLLGVPQLAAGTGEQAAEAA